MNEKEANADSLIQSQYHAFRLHFGREATAEWFSPGRVNLIGEHTDYNGGWVLPIAINLGTRFLIGQNGENQLRVASQSRKDDLRVPLQDLDQCRPQNRWTDYFVGVARDVKKLAKNLAGVDVLVDSTLPIGSGLSSSASITVGMASVLNDVWACALEREDLIKIAKRAENAFVGVGCGILDPFAVAMGRRGHAMALHCSDTKWDYVRFPGETYSVVVADTGVSRQLANTPFNRRREESRAALELVARLSGKDSTSDLLPEDLECLRGPEVTPIALPRARHVVTENIRVKKAVQALKNKDIETFGQTMIESHESLRDDYEVSCRELDVMVDLSVQHKACAGAKMTGAGFGGAVVAVVRSEYEKDFVQALYTGYRAASQHLPKFYVCRIGQGTHKVIAR